MKPILIIIFLISFQITKADSNEMAEVFRKIPNDLILDLNDNAIDSLLEFGRYTFPGGDSIITEEIAVTESTEEFLQVHYGFTTGQRAFLIIEIRKFKISNDKSLIVFAKFGGLYAAFDQHILKTFILENDKLILVDNLRLPESISVFEFLKEDIPDSIRNEYLDISSGYNLNPDMVNSIEYFIYPQTERFDVWIKTENVNYLWNGEKFYRKD